MAARSLPEQSRQAVQDLIALLYADTPLRVVEQRACERARETLDADCVFLGVGEKGRTDIPVTVCKGDEHEFDPRPLLEKAISSRQRTFTSNGSAAVAVPIFFGDTVFGALCAYDKRRARFFDIDAETLEAFGQYVAIARANHAKLREITNALRWERRTSWILIAVAILACIALAAFGYFSARSNNVHVMENAGIASDRSSDILDRYVAGGEQLARTAAAVGPTFRGNRTGTENFLIKLLTSTPSDVVYGIGIWYEPFKFSRTLRLFGPYVHRTTTGKIVLTYEWSHVNYNYFRHEWFQIGLKARNQALVTPPYFDTDHVYISAVHDMVAHGQSIGVVSVDTTSDSINMLLSRLSWPQNLAYLTNYKGGVVAFPNAPALLAFTRTRHPAKIILDVTDADARAFITQRYPGQRITIQRRAARIPVILTNSLDAAGLGAMPPPIMMLAMTAVLIWLLTFAAIWAMRRARARGVAELDLHRERTRLSLEINARVSAEEALRKAAERDPLTGLMNRKTILTAIDQSIEAARAGATPNSLLFVDLNGFERINTVYGHVAGDQILEDFAEMLAECARSGDMLARLGGDEFAVLVHGDTNAARQIGECLHHAMKAGLRIESESVYLDAGMGVVEIQGTYNAAEDVIRDADYALYQSKLGQRATVVEFDPSLREDAAKDRELQAALRGAVTRREIFVEYQPICRIRNGELVGFEALARWQRDGQELFPSEFIPLAERSGLVCDLDRYVADVACAQVAQWQRVRPDLRLEINASALHFEKPGGLSDFTEALQRHAMRPDTLDVELTESSFMGLTNTAVAGVQELHRKGINLHLDDFGTGYSSLTYLLRLQVDALKIDRSFVETMLQDERSMRIVSAIVNLARSLGVEVIAEGVTTHEEVQTLEKLGVTLAQGYFYAHPMRAEDAARLVESTVARN